MCVSFHARNVLFDWILVETRSGAECPASERRKEGRSPNYDSGFCPNFVGGQFDRSKDNTSYAIHPLWIDHCSLVSLQISQGPQGYAGRANDSKSRKYIGPWRARFICFFPCSCFSLFRFTWRIYLCNQFHYNIGYWSLGAHSDRYQEFQGA